MKIELATELDVQQLAHLVNTCYRGEESVNGWTYDGGLIQGERTNPNFLLEHLRRPAHDIIKCTKTGDDDDDDDSSSKEIVACVLVDRENDKLHMEMLCVHPKYQSRGLGGKMMKAVEDYAKRLRCDGVYIEVVNAHNELFAWYGRAGFKTTGKNIEFPEPEAGCGKPVIPIVLVEMKKSIHLN